MAKDFFNEKRPHNGLTFEEYFQRTEKQIKEKKSETLDDKEKNLFEYTKLNYQRTQRILKTYKVDKEFCEKLNSLEKKQLWMVLTEDWCGDSAQNLPYIKKISDCSDDIDLRILLRDDNLDIMDQYLTNGKSRSIPKLIAFDMDGNELFQWGPRPKEAQELAKSLKDEGINKDKFNENLHLWYGRNRGKNLENEFKELLEAK